MYYTSPKILQDKLKKLGWTEAPTKEDPYQMAPPRSLCENMPKQFDVYEAELIQELLGKPVPPNPDDSD